jgi:hypothetical protein
MAGVPRPLSGAPRPNFLFDESSPFHARSWRTATRRFSIVSAGSHPKWLH